MAALGTAVVLAALSACSGDDDSSDDDAQSSPSAAPETTPATSPPPSPSATSPSPAASPSSSPSSTEPDVGSLEAKCAKMGKGMPEAKEYKGKGPHTMAVFQDDYAADTDSPGTYVFWQVRFPKVKIIVGDEDAADMELLVCGKGSKGTQPLGSCNYTTLGTDPTTYPLYSQTYEYTVYELRTGKALQKLSSAGAAAPDGCPGRIDPPYGSGKKPGKVYANMTSEQTEDLLRQFVTGPAQ